MLSVRSLVQGWGRRQASLAAALLVAMMMATPAAASGLFGERTVDVQFATQDGKPLADAEVRVFAPGAPGRAVVTGRTDKDGKFSFETDRDGLWTAEARNGSEIARATVRVGTQDEQKNDNAPQSPYLILGLLVLLLVIAVWYRFLRARARARAPTRAPKKPR